MFKEQYWCSLTAGELQSSDVSILGVPFDGAVSGSRGAARAPCQIRELSKKMSPFSEEGLDLRSLTIFDQGNVPPDLDWERYFDTVYRQAFRLLSAGGFSLFLGGDHSVTIPLAGAFCDRYKDEPVGMIHLDSHCDLMDQYNGHRWSHACPQRRFLEHDNASPESLVMVGIRNYEEEELDYLRKTPEITVIGARQFHHKGHNAALEQIINALRGIETVYLSLDIDVLDPAFAPGTGTPEGGGLTTREAIEIVRAALAELPVKAMDIVEVAPPLDHSNITSLSALKIIYEVFAGLVSKRQ